MLSPLGSPAFPSRVPLLLLWLLEDLIRPRDSAYPMRPNSLSPPLSAVLSGERHSTQASGWSHLCVASGPAHGRCSQSGSPTEGSFSLAPRGQPLSQLLTSLSSVRFGSSTHLPGWLGFPQRGNPEAYKAKYLVLGEGPAPRLAQILVLQAD